MINTDPIYQEWTIQRDRQQWAQDVEQRQKNDNQNHQNTQHRKVKR